MVSDIRRDIERAARQKPKPEADIDITDVLKGAAAVGGGVLAGRYVGKRIRRWINNRNLGKHAMEHVKRYGDTRSMVPADSGSRFRRKA